MTATTQQRTHLYTTLSAKSAMDELDRLAALFLKQMKRKHKVDLYFSSFGEDSKLRYGVAVYAEPADRDEVLFFQSNVLPTTIT